MLSWSHFSWATLHDYGIASRLKKYTNVCGVDLPLKRATSIALDAGENDEDDNENDGDQCQRRQPDDSSQHELFRLPRFFSQN